MRIKLIGAFLLLSCFAGAQNIPDGAIASWERTGITGTARTVGAGGAFGSVGADLGCIAINPAGLGIYRSTDFSVTPLVLAGSNESVYDGSHTNARKPYFFLAQGGFVFTKLFKNNGNDNYQQSFSNHPLKSLSFALNFQQQNIFNRYQTYTATNKNESMVDGYVDLLNYYNQPPDYFPPEIQVASIIGLIGQNTNGTYYSNLKAPVQQTGLIQTKGNINRIDAAFGFNLMDKLYLGFDLAVPILGYSLSSTITEAPTTAQANQITDYTLNSITSESGVGFNGIIGLIYRPFPFMRVGASYHLPTWYAMHEDYQINFNEDSGSYQFYNQDPLALPSFQYGLRTPMKGDFSASFYYKNYGFISVDYDMENLGASRIHVPNDSLGYQSYYNDLTTKTYKMTHTLHAGLEGAIKVVRLRAGYSFSSSPFKSGQQVNAGYNDVRNAITAGIGVRLKHFYADVAYVYSWRKDASIELTNYNFPVNNICNSSTILLTLGWKFEAGTKSNNQQRTTQQRYTPPPVDDEQRY